MRITNNEDVPGCVQIELITRGIDPDLWKLNPAKDWFGLSELPGFGTYEYERQKEMKKKSYKIEIDLFEEIKTYLLGTCSKYRRLDELFVENGKLYANYGNCDLRVTYDQRQNKRYVKAFRLLKKLKRLMDEVANEQ